MAIPYVIFLGIYLVAVFFILIFVAVNLLHIIRLSRISSYSALALAVFIVGLMLILSMSYHSLKKIDWQQSLNVMDTITDSVKEFNPL